MLTKCDCALVVDTKTSTDDWCAFEHLVQFSPEEPPEIILVSVAKLVDVFRLVQGKTNSEWVRIFANGGKVLVRIIAIGEQKNEVFRHAMEHIRDLPKVPVCNQRGHSLKTAKRAVVCLTNGRRYDSQVEAARDLGIHASAISRHLNGDITHAQGFTFAWAPPPVGEPIMTVGL